LLQSKDIDEIKNVLYDNRSKEEFISVLSFRKKIDINYLSGFKFRINEQYFEDFITFDSYPVFIDGGGYMATSLRFAELYPQIVVLLLLNLLMFGLRIRREFEQI
jgi:hypothetical protein